MHVNNHLVLSEFVTALLEYILILKQSIAETSVIQPPVGHWIPRLKIP